MLQALKLEQERLNDEEMAKKSKITQKEKKPKEEAKTMDNKNDKNVSDAKNGIAETADHSVTTPIESSTVPPGEKNKELHQTEEHFHVRANTHRNILISCIYVWIKDKNRY